MGHGIAAVWLVLLCILVLVLLFNPFWWWSLCPVIWAWTAIAGMYFEKATKKRVGK